MKAGNEIEHLADEARRQHRAETTWLALRNTYFRDGTSEDAWAAMVGCFAGMGVRAVSERRRLNGREVEFVLLTPMRSRE